MTLVQQNNVGRGWTSRAKRDDEPVPSHQFDGRIRDRLSALRDEAEAARAAERQLFDEVDRLRGDAAIGRADRKDLLAAQKRLAKAQERSADADAAVRAGERWELSERAAYGESVRRYEIAVHAEAKGREREIVARAASTLTAFLAELDEIERDITELKAAYSTGDPNRPVMYGTVADLRADVAARATHFEERAR